RAPSVGHGRRPAGDRGGGGPRPPARLRVRQRPPAERRRRGRRGPSAAPGMRCAGGHIESRLQVAVRAGLGEPGREVRMAREPMLARTFVELADTLVDDFDVVELLTLLVDRCVEILDVSAAGLMLVAPEGDLRVVASSSEEMRVAELFELQSEEGPCPDCYRTGEAVVSESLPTDGGCWPRFGPVAREAGFRSVHAVPMRLRG